METIIQNSLSKGCTFAEYRDKITSLLKEGKATGNEQSEDLVHYTGLNETRMNRLAKTLVIAEGHTQKLQHLKRKYIWLVISEGWCGDSAQIVPIIHKMAEQSENIDLKIVFRDENEALINRFLTNGTRSVPKLIILDKNTLEILGDFGPRPLGANQLILDYKAKHGMVDEVAKTELHLWYFHDKGIGVQNEIMEIMGNLD